jgi:hypothetical protein
VIDRNATNFQRYARRENVRVPAVTYSHAHRSLVLRILTAPRLGQSQRTFAKDLEQSGAGITRSSGPVLQIKFCQLQIARMGDFQIFRGS